MQLGVWAVLHIADAISDTRNDDNLSAIITLIKFNKK